MANNENDKSGTNQDTCDIKSNTDNIVKQQKAMTPDAVEKNLGEMYRKIKIHLEPSIPGPDGIRFDFNCGVRVMIPHGATRNYRVEYWDDESGQRLFDGVIKSGDRLQGGKYYFRRYLLKISDAATGQTLLLHRFNLKGRTVIVHIPVSTIGDTIAWFVPVEEFQRRHECNVLVCMSLPMRKLFEAEYPALKFIDEEEMLNYHSYAQYQMGIDLEGKDELMPYDWRLAPLHWVGSNILGVEPREMENKPPRIAYDKGKREVAEPYVCISSMASGGCKLWMNPRGWETVVEFLKQCGYRVLDIDGQRITGKGITYQRPPCNAEDFTGFGEGKNLQDRAAMIHHADFFIGLGSGLSWLSWALHKPTVLISGFSLPYCEFYTPYRVINTNVCHGCFNDPKYVFDNSECFWCPRHQTDNQHMICSLTITPEMVINAILRIPEFQKHMERVGKVVQECEHGGKSEGLFYTPTSYPLRFKVAELTKSELLENGNVAGVNSEPVIIEDIKVAPVENSGSIKELDIDKLRESENAIEVIKAKIASAEGDATYTANTKVDVRNGKIEIKPGDKGASEAFSALSALITKQTTSK